MRAWASAILLVAFSGQAYAAVSAIERSGSWQAFGGSSVDGTPVCGASTGWPDGRVFSIKVYGSDQSITIQLSKPTWQIPTAAPVQISMSFGGFSPWTVTAKGDKDTVEFDVPAPSVGEFAREFKSSGGFAVVFLSGSEPPWQGSLAGSSAAANGMGACVNIMQGRAPTQPFSTAPTPPAPPSQPYQPQSSPVPTAPSTPAPTDGFDHV